MAEKGKNVYIVGHRNPDTDSICSAIAYADIKNRTENSFSFVAARAGQINEETEFVLDYFNMDLPEYLPDAATQVGEIEIHKVPGVDQEMTVKDAWERMKEENIVTLCITDKDEKVKGVITVTDIAKSYMDIHDSDILSLARSTFQSIAKTLKGNILVEGKKKIFDNGRVVVGAFDPDVMRQYIREDDLVIVGNRPENQLCCIDVKASCMVVGLETEVPGTIQHLARENGCTIISSPYDTYHIARLINQALPIRYLMTSKNVMSFNVSDKVSDVESVMKNSRHRDYPIVDHKERYIGTISRRNLLGRGGKRLILVDHNEKSQAVLNVDQAEVVEIIDHHRLGAIETMSPIIFRNEPVGCTCTIMYEIYREKELDIPREIAGLMMSAIISDTLLFRSPTCTDKDREACRDLAEIAGIDNIESYAKKMFKAGSNLESKTPEEIFYQDFKKFNIESESFGVGQISSMSGEELALIKDRIKEQLRTETGSHGMGMVFFMLTNIIDETTELLFYGDGSKELIEESYGLFPEGDSCILDGVVSRKKQLIPAFLNALQKRD